MDNNSDLGATKHSQYSWDSEHAMDSLDGLFAQITGEADNAINWYLKAKAPRKKRALFLRLSAIAMGAVAGVIPLLSQLIKDHNGMPIIQPAWASVALAVAAASVPLDRFFGYSSSWMRYVVAELTLRQLNEEFQLDWESCKAQWCGQSPSCEQIQVTLGRFKAFVTQVNTVVRQETDAWIQEFRATLAQLDETAKTASATGGAGAVNVEVTNGDQSEGGWTLAVDNGSRITCQGKNAGVPNLTPGLHVIRIAGTIAGKPVETGLNVVVGSGAVASAQVTLS